MKEIHNPKVSVIIPIYNSENVLGHCVKSILNQTLSDIEVILVNDGSSDNSLLVCEEMQQKDSRIKIINKTNEGRVCARRDGFLEAKGDYIAFSDHDDYMPKYALGNMYDIAASNDLDLIVGNHERVFDDWRLVKKNRNLYKNTDKVLTSKQNIYTSFFGIEIGFNDGISDFPWGRLYKRECIKKAVEKKIEGVFPSQKKNVLHEDLYFNLSISPFVNKMWITNEIVYYHRYGGASRMNVFSPMISGGGGILTLD